VVIYAYEVQAVIKALSAYFLFRILYHMGGGRVEGRLSVSFNDSSSYGAVAPGNSEPERSTPQRPIH